MEIVEQKGLFDEGLVQANLFGETKKRVLIEGGFQDDWGRLHSVHPTELLIPDTVTRINVRHLGSRFIPDPLILVYRWIDQYLISTTDLKEEKGEEFNLFDYDCLQAVSSVITEDGRVFFDTSLITDSFKSTQNNRTRLDRYLGILKEQNEDINPVNLFFTPEGRKRFRAVPIVVYNPPE